MLAYAARDCRAIREANRRTDARFLQRAVEALTGLAEACRGHEGGRLQPIEKYLAFLAVLDRDARDSLAAIELVLAQPPSVLS